MAATNYPSDCETISFIEEEEAKIFCQNCKHVRSSSDCFGGVYITCNATKIISKTPEPVGWNRTYEKLEEKNKNNNCKDFSQKRLWHIPFANTNG